jgi:hypothetical protein
MRRERTIGVSYRTFPLAFKAIYVPTKVEVYPLDETNKEIFILVEIFCETKMQSKQRNIYSS